MKLMIVTIDGRGDGHKEIMYEERRCTGTIGLICSLCMCRQTAFTILLYRTNVGYINTENLKNSFGGVSHTHTMTLSHTYLLIIYST
jgi:hypothetical protein